MDEQEYPIWMTVSENEILKFSDLPHLIAKAQHPSDDKSWEYVAARINLNKELSDSVHRGTFVVRNASGLGVHTFPHGQALKDAVVLPQDLAPFLNARGIGLRRTNQASPERVVIADLANALSRELADAFPNWAKDDADNDLRRDIAAAMNVHGLEQIRLPGILPHIVRMATQGLITPRSTFNGMPALNPANDINCTWYLSPEDAEEVRRALVSVASMPPRQVGPEDEGINAWQKFMALDDKQGKPEYQAKLARAHDLLAELATWKAMQYDNDPDKFAKIEKKKAEIEAELARLDREYLDEAGSDVKVTKKANNLSTAKRGQKWDEHELRRLFGESKDHGWSAKQAASDRGVSRQMIEKMLKKAKEQFGPRKADAFSPRIWPGKK